MASPDFCAETAAGSHRSFSGSASGTYLGERQGLSLGVRGGVVVCDGERGFDIAILPSIYNESYVFCDIGVGLEVIESRSWLSAFLSFNVSFLEEGTSPFLNGEFGYSFGSEPGRSAADMRGFMIGLGTGVRIPVERYLNFRINVGYRLQRAGGRDDVRGPFDDVYSGLEDIRYDIYRATLGVSFK